jgi:TnpA family transposase
MTDALLRSSTWSNETYVDSHPQSEIGFGVSRLLDFELLPRMKRINKAKLYRPFSPNSRTK